MAEAADSSRRPERTLSRELEDLARTLRGSLASLRAAAEVLDRHPEAAAERRRQLFAVVADESERLGGLADRLEALGASLPRPSLRRLVAVAELLEALRAAGAVRGVPWTGPPRLEPGDAGDTLLEVDVEGLAEASAEVLASLRREFAVPSVELRAKVASPHLLIAWLWRPEPGDLDLLRDWPGEALDRALRPIARDLAGEAWFNLDRDGENAYIRLLLPVADPRADRRPGK